MSTPSFAIVDATIAICSGVTPESLLAEREPARVDLEVVLGEEELSALVEAARPLLVAGSLEAGVGVHAEPAAVVEDRRVPRAACRPRRRRS